jgi:hypothetical protein
MRRSLAISIVLHGVILAALALYTGPKRFLSRAGNEAVDVVLVSVADNSQGGASRTPVPSPSPPSPSRDTPGSQLPPDGAAGNATGSPPSVRPAPAGRESRADARTRNGKVAARMRLAPERRRRELVEARTLYTGAALASPLGQATLAQLEQAHPEERIVQLCIYEAVEQTRRERPDLRIDHARAQVRKEATISGFRVSAPGAAVQGSGLWYDLAFSCDVEPDLAGVARFAFALGRQIPRAEVGQLGLPTGGPMH